MTLTKKRSSKKRVSKRKSRCSRSIKRSSRKRSSRKISSRKISSRKRSSRKVFRKIYRGGFQEESPSSSSFSSTPSSFSSTPTSLLSPSGSNHSSSSELNNVQWPELNNDNTQNMQELFNNQLLQHLKEQDDSHRIYFSSNENLYNFLNENSKMSNKLKSARNDIDSFFKSDVKKIKISFIDGNYQDLVDLMISRSNFRVDETFNSVLSYFIKLFLNQPFQYLEKIESNKLVQDKSDLYISSAFIIAYLVLKQEFPDFDTNEEIKLLLVPKGDDTFHFLNQTN
jgi:hypothetical protein